jgi:small subunit ribosomal protein S18
MADETTPQSAPPQATQQSTPAPASAGSAPSAPSAPPSSGGYQGGQGGGQGGHGGPRHSGPGGPGGRPSGPGGPAKRGKRSFVRKKKVCRFCVDKADYIDYKKAEILAPFIQERGKILPRRMTGTCARHQRWLAVAIKRAQNIALLPFAAEL